MRDFPHRRSEPLAPPDGAFEDVLRRARERRYRNLTRLTSVSALVILAVSGGLAMGAGTGGVDTVLSFGRDRSAESPPPSPSPTAS